VSASVVDALCSPVTRRLTCVFSMNTRAATTPIAVAVSKSMIRLPSSTGTQKASATPNDAHTRAKLRSPSRRWKRYADTSIGHG
jgi:hypothetical protein